VLVLVDNTMSLGLGWVGRMVSIVDVFGIFATKVNRRVVQGGGDIVLRNLTFVVFGDSLLLILLGFREVIVVMYIPDSLS
jgi:hypothetical protein